MIDHAVLVAVREPAHQALERLRTQTHKLTLDLISIF